VLRNNVLETVRAEREVIVCAGAYHSPHLLLLSGIGPADELRALGIRMHHRRDRHRHVVLRHRAASSVVGRPLPGQRQVGRQTPIRQDPRRLQMAGLRARRSRHGYLQGIDSAEIIETVHARRAPMIPVSASPRS
jgi:choline dehydrogenase-like flavoprotein